MLAKKQTIGIALLAMLMATLLVSICFGEDVREQGVVSVTKDANGEITAAQLTTDAVAYNVELDAKGMELAAMDGKKVEVTGVASEKDGQKWLTVLEFTAVVEGETK